MEDNNSVTVFLVDDDQMFIEALKHYLSDNPNIKPRDFLTAEDCLNHLEEGPNVIILDYYLNSTVPNAMNGIEALKKIKATHPHIPIVILSAQDNIEIAMETIKYGAFDYVSKSESALVKIKNIINNVANSSESTNKLNKKLSLYKTINISIIILLILLFVISRMI